MANKKDLCLLNPRMISSARFAAVTVFGILRHLPNRSTPGNRLCWRQWITHRGDMPHFPAVSLTDISPFTCRPALSVSYAYLYYMPLWE